MLAFNRGRFNRPAGTSKYFTGRASVGVIAAAGMNTNITLSGASDIAVLTYDGALITIKASGQVSRIRLLGEVSDNTRIPNFNRMAFNRGKFNASAHKRSNANVFMSAAGDLTVTRAFSGEAGITLNTGSGALNASSTFGGDSKITLFADADISASYSFAGTADIILSAVGRMNIIHNLNGAAFVVLEAIGQDFNTFRVEYIELPDLVLRTGDELIIDTDAKTITLNGQNVMRHFSRTSDFFNFNPRENEIEYLSNNPDDRVEIRILWKDAWL